MDMHSYITKANWALSYSSPPYDDRKYNRIPEKFDCTMNNSYIWAHIANVKDKPL